MEADKVCEQLKYIQQSGTTLGIEERMQLECALHNLQSSMCFESLFFWGKINGKLLIRKASNDYCAKLIALIVHQESKLITTWPWDRTHWEEKVFQSVPYSGANRPHGNSVCCRRPRCNSLQFLSKYRRCSLVSPSAGLSTHRASLSRFVFARTPLMLRHSQHAMVSQSRTDLATW